MQANLGAGAAAHDCLWRFADPDVYIRYLHAPVPLAGRRFAIAAGDLTPENRAWLKVHYGDRVPIAACDRRLVLSLIEKRFRTDFAHAATSELSGHRPEFSASTTITRAQVAVFAFLIALLTLCCCVSPRLCAIAATAMLCVLFTANGLFRALLLLIGAIGKREMHAAPVADSDLPIYTILVPLYHEAHMVPSLVRDLSALRYPSDRLDIKLIVEQADDETSRAAEAAATDPRFSVIRVPRGSPRTKPRACNYALSLALGEFTVIFDAEDRPEPDQLRKAVAAFRALPDNVACLQARLNFYNAGENWLTAGLMAQTPQAGRKVLNDLSPWVAV